MTSLNEETGRLFSRRYSRRRVLGTGGTLAGAGLAAVLVGCGDDDDTSNGGGGGGGTSNGSGSPSNGNGNGGNGEARQGGTVRIAATQDLAHMDPHTETITAGHLVALTHAALLRFASSDDPSVLTPEPYVAESVEFSDPTTVTVRLRDDVHFHDEDPVNGRQVTAEDVKFSIERIMTDEPDFQRRSLFEPVETIDVVDERTVQLNLERPFAPLMTYLADTWNVIIPREIVERDGDMRNSALGAGPFRLTSYERGTGTQFERNPNFFLGAPHLDGVRMPILQDTAAVLAAFQAKQLDYMRTIPWAEVPRFETDDAYELATYMNADLQYIRLNLDVEPLNDDRVRRALSYAIDRDELVETAFQGHGAPSGIFPNAVRWAMLPDELPHYQYDPEEATALLSAAGQSNLVLENLRPSSTSLQAAETDVVVAQLGRIGVQVENRVLEYGAYLQAAFSREFQINVHWGNRYDEPDGYPMEYLQDGARNFGSWGSDELDALVISQREELDEDARGEIFREIQLHLAEEMYNVGLANWSVYDGWNSALKNVKASSHWFKASQELSDAWLDA